MIPSIRSLFIPWSCKHCQIFVLLSLARQGRPLSHAAGCRRRDLTSTFRGGRVRNERMRLGHTWCEPGGSANSSDSDSIRLEPGRDKSACAPIPGGGGGGGGGTGRGNCWPATLASLCSHLSLTQASHRWKRKHVIRIVLLKNTFRGFKTSNKVCFHDLTMFKVTQHTFFLGLNLFIMWSTHVISASKENYPKCYWGLLCPKT